MSKMLFTGFFKNRLKRAGMVLLLAFAFLLQGCSFFTQEKAEDEPVTTSFEEDTVFTVADVRVSLPEWYLYSAAQYDETQSMYGSKVWDYTVDREGTVFADAMKDEILERIKYIKIVCVHAEEMGISLDEDDRTNISIATEDFMERLDSATAQKYGITEETVRSVYSDNLLAMKVYENITLNVDTDIPEEQVRHMVLQYISVLKSYENDEGEIVAYSDEELREIEEGLQSYLDSIEQDEAVTMLSLSSNSDYAVMELNADYAELAEKLPGDLPNIAFSMRENAIAGIYETADAFFILDCVEQTDEETTNEARIAIIEARQKELFEEKYKVWAEDVVIKMNYNIWKDLQLK